MVKLVAIPQILKRASIQEDSAPIPPEHRRSGYSAYTPASNNTFGGTEVEKQILQEGPLLSPLSQLSTPSVHLSKNFNFGGDGRNEEYFGRMRNNRTPSLKSPVSPQTPSFHYNKAFNFGTTPVTGQRSAGEAKRDSYFSKGSGLQTPGRVPDMVPDTPSAYTDMVEYSVVGGPSRGGMSAFGSYRHDRQMQSPRHERHFASDPYSTRASRMRLGRTNTSNTLGPDDSVSSYNVKAVSRNLSMIPSEVDMGEEDPYRQPAPYRESSYQDTSNHRFSYRGSQHDTTPSRPQSYYSNYNDGMSSRPYSYNNAPEPSTPVPEPHELYDPTYGHKLYISTGDDTLMSYHSGLNYAEDDEMKEREAYWPDSSTYQHHGPHDTTWEQKVDSPQTFANRPLHGEPPMDGRRRSVEEGYGGEDKGLLARLPYGNRQGPDPGWGGTIEEQIARRRRGIGRQRYPVLTWILAIAFVVIFIVELVQSKQQTGQAIQTSPSWNPMLGPPFEFLISFGARFDPCMRNVPQIPTTTQMTCLRSSTLSTSSLTQSDLCPIWQICGLPDAKTTGQAYRFVTPIFVHAGLIHIAFNLMVQLTLCAQIEKLLSTPFYAIVYLAGGIGGALLGGNFGLVGQPSVGASGAIYSSISVELVDLCYNWKYEYRPRMRLLVSIIFAVVGFVIGLLPGLDNFAHIGGFAVGILGGLLFCPSIHATRRHLIATWVLRIVAAGLFVGFFVGLVTNFYESADPTEACTWCRYLSCLPVFSQCKGTGLTTTTTSTSST